MTLLRIAWHAFLGSPVVGIGHGAFEAFSTRDPEIGAVTAGQGYATHNTYVEILVEGGLLAFVCFALHFLQYVRRLPAVLREVRRRRDAEAASFVVVLPIALIAAAFMNVLPYYLFWASCGLTLAFLNVRRRERLATEAGATRTAA